MRDNRQAALEGEIAELRAQLEACRAELTEARAQQTATGEVLQLINSSPGDLAPVFDAIVEKAHALCDATQGSLQLWDGEMFRGVAMRGFPEDMVRALRRGYSPGPNHPCRLLLDGERVVHCADMAEVDDPVTRQGAKLSGIRTVLYLALRKDTVLLGQIVAGRQQVRPFAAKEIALVENFAAQAVIAMENARLLGELRQRTHDLEEALEYQTAISDVLRVISGSVFELERVLKTVVSTAIRLCRADEAVIFRNIEGEYRWAAGNSLAPEYEVIEREVRIRPGTGTLVGRTALQGRTVHILDAWSDPLYEAKDDARIGGIHTMLGVPLMRDGQPIGVIGLARRRIEAYTDKEIGLVRTFADQAVIAIENARLLTETREALEQQTATAEVLQVINSSPGDLAPVFDAMLDKATRLCQAPYCQLVVYDGEFFRFVAVHGETYYAEQQRRDPVLPSFGVTWQRIVRGAAIVHIADVLEDDGYQAAPPSSRALVDASGMRTLLTVALRKDDVLLGTLTVYRQEVRPFSEKEIALVENFAAQAVIAMENARLLTETREALEQQTAIAEVLQVINSSPGNLAPVFEAILERAHSLCAAPCGSLQVFDREWLRAVATRGMPEPFAAMLREGFRPLPGTVNSLDPRQVDMELAARSNPDERVTRAGVDVAKLRTTLFVPLHKDNVFLGRIVAARQELRPFSDKQIALLQNFAAQAVIAMENARLLTETREALEQQTATAEVLQVINSSPGDLQPVFDAILEKALNLCGAAFGVLWHYEGGLLHATAIRGATPEYADFLSGGTYEPAPVSAHGRLLAGADVVHIADVADHEDYRSGNPTPRALVDLGGGRTLLAVPLRKDDAFLGDMMIYRREVRPFADKQIALLQNFAAQAVIAMDNARLLQEIRQRQAELRVTFDNMGDGVAMFDAELRLAAWNRNFQEILDLPDRFVAERPKFAEYFRYLAGRGEYASTDLEAELRGRLDDPEREMRFERARPDGRVVEVRRNPVPGGGFVMIYSDVTARKRAEGEIRTARDAAEKALAELKTTQASLIHAEKMASLGQLTAGIAHEIKNPLNFVNNFAGLSVELLDELKAAAGPGIAALDPDTRAEIDETIQMLTGNLDKITEHGRRADGIVQSMLLHSRGGSGERQRVDLNALVHEALNLAFHGARAQDQDFNITLERDFAASMPLVELVPQDMMRVFINLISNGFHAARQRLKDAHGSGFRPLLKVATRDLGDAVEIRVRDNGIGIAPEHRDKLFQPFFTTKPSGEGTGLGLSISYDIVAQQHGGTISVDSEPGVFTEFTVRLPRR